MKTSYLHLPSLLPYAVASSLSRLPNESTSRKNFPRFSLLFSNTSTKGITILDCYIIRDEIPGNWKTLRIIITVKTAEGEVQSSQQSTIRSLNRSYSKIPFSIAPPNDMAWTSSNAWLYESKDCSRVSSALQYSQVQNMLMPTPRTVTRNCELTILLLLSGAGRLLREAAPCRWRWKWAANCKIHIEASRVFLERAVVLTYLIDFSICLLPCATIWSVCLLSFLMVGLHDADKQSRLGRCCRHY